MEVKLIQSTPDPVLMIAKIASICYDSEPKNPIGLVKHLYMNGHHSVFEHIYFTFKISGVSRACSHQLVRHRHCSFTQRSQRYCTETDTGFILPNDNKFDFKTPLENIYKDYYKALSAGVKPEDARALLPNATETELYMSLNLRELIHIANERLCLRAQDEIRNLAKEMCKLIDEDLQFMLKPKCASGFLVCNEKDCRGTS